MIQRIKRNEMAETIAQYRPFICGSARGEINGYSYLLWSYNTKIAEVDMAEGELVYFDPTHYSPTTSMLQNAIKQVFKEG